MRSSSKISFLETLCGAESSAVNNLHKDVIQQC